jgi:single-stranded DNA-binding protein
MIDCAFYRFLAADAETKVSKAGKTWVRLRVGVGKDDDLQWISVAVFGPAAEVAAKLKKGDRCYVEGSIKLDTWTGNDGTERHGLSVAAFKCERTHNIGRNREHNGRSIRWRVAPPRVRPDHSPRPAAIIAMIRSRSGGDDERPGCGSGRRRLGGSSGLA